MFPSSLSPSLALSAPRLSASVSSSSSSLFLSLPSLCVSSLLLCLPLSVSCFCYISLSPVSLSFPLLPPKNQAKMDCFHGDSSPGSLRCWQHSGVKRPAQGLQQRGRWQLGTRTALHLAPPLCVSGLLSSLLESPAESPSTLVCHPPTPGPIALSPRSPV